MTEKIVEPARKTLTVEEFLARSAVATQSVTIPELGGDVVIRGVSLEERDRIMAGSVNMDTGKQDPAVFAALTVLTGLVEPKLTAAHIAELKAKKFGVLNSLANKIWSASGVGVNGAAGEAAKNG